jgi:putative ABC transport system substrate-binding protein
VSAALAIVRSLILNVVMGTALLSALAWAEQPSIARIGVITAGPENSPWEENLRNGLRELGYVEGKNIVIEWRRSLGTDEELRSVASQLAASKVELIVAFSTPAAGAALRATTVPVVFVAGDPVGAGLAASLARPGGQGTGVSMFNRELAGKRMELLRQVAPSIRRIVFLMNPSNPLDARMLEEAQKAARTLSVKLDTLGARNADELDVALRALPRSAADGLLVANDLFLVVNRAKVTQAVRKAKLPAIFPFKEYHDAGALMSYGPTTREATRAVAVYVDKILKGAKPSELPIEQMSKYELIIDLRVARAMGIHVPQELLLRADEVIR